MDNITEGGTRTERDGACINVALAFSDPHGSYARHAAVVMASIFANTRSRVCVYILHDDTLTDENTSKLRQTADSFGQMVTFVSVEGILDIGIVGVRELSSAGFRGMSFRLLIPRLLGCRKVIYLDCDVVVNIDLREMWETDMGGCPVAAARDVWSHDCLKGKKIGWRTALVYKALGVDKDKYFNSGVLLMDLDKIRKDYDFIAEAAAFYGKYKKAILLADQDCLNHIFAGGVRFLDARFNCIRPEDLDNGGGLAAIWHMAGAKPWEIYSRPGTDDLYWHYLTMTPWGADRADLINALLQGLGLSRHSHRHSSDCVKRLKGQMYENIFKAHIWLVPNILFAFILHRPKNKK